MTPESLSTRSLLSPVGQLRVRNAMTPILWLAHVGAVVCLAFAFLFRDRDFAFYPLLILGVLQFVLAWGIVVYFAVTRPQLLQSEDFQIRDRTIDLIEMKGGPISVSPASLQQIAAISAPLHLPPGATSGDE
jgi:hypothetical protein